MSRSLERSIECCKSQARNYSSLAGIELRPSQIQKYVDLRIVRFYPRWSCFTWHSARRRPTGFFQS